MTARPSPAAPGASLTGAVALRGGVRHKGLGAAAAGAGRIGGAGGAIGGAPAGGGGSNRRVGHGCRPPATITARASITRPPLHKYCRHARATEVDASKERGRVGAAAVPRVGGAKVGVVVRAAACRAVELGAKLTLKKRRWLSALAGTGDHLQEQDTLHLGTQWPFHPEFAHTQPPTPQPTELTRNSAGQPRRRPRRPRSTRPRRTPRWCTSGPGPGRRRW